MPDQRLPIPADLDRRVRVEAGHMCAVPTCKQVPIEIAHIVPWAQVKKHEFDNLIALCPTCHTRYDRGDIDRKAMLMYKAQLAPSIDIIRELQERIERIAEEANKPKSEAPHGFAFAVALYRNRTCPIGVVDGSQFVTIGTCTFVRPRVAVVPGIVLDKITAFLKSRGEHAAVWEPSGMSAFREMGASHEYGDLRLIELGPVPDYAFEFLRKEYPKEEQEFMKSQFAVSETPIRANLGIYIGDHVGFLTAPYNTEELRGAMEFQFQDAYVSFKGDTLKSGVQRGYLTPIPSALNHAGAPVFRSDGTLLALLTDVIFIDGEIGGRPVFTTLLSLPELWKKTL